MKTSFEKPIDPKGASWDHIKPETLTENKFLRLHRIELSIDGIPVGHASITYHGKPFPFYYINYINVLPQYRGNKFGSGIVEKINSFLKEHNRAGILYEDLDNGNISGTYERHGWQQFPGGAEVWKSNYFTFNLPTGVNLKELEVAFKQIDKTNNKRMYKESLEEGAKDNQPE